MTKALALICAAGIALVTSACQSVAPASLPAATAPRVAPDSDVFLAELDLAAGTVGKVRNITRRPGYDNQPTFLADGNALWFVSDRSGANDVYRYDIDSAGATQVTATKESEFSPTPLPEGEGFSAIRVAAPDSVGEAYTESQQLWRYSADGVPLASVLPMRRVGYHAWLDASHVVLSLVGSVEQKQAKSVVLADLASGSTVLLAMPTGRSLGRTPDGKRISFVDKRDPANWMVVAMAPGDNAPTPLVATPKGPPGEKDSERSEDYCWLPDGGLLMAKDSQLLRWDGKTGGAFRPFADLKDLGGAITRLAVSRDGKRLAFVVQMR